jgi:hypothetical protein
VWRLEYRAAAFLLAVLIWTASFASTAVAQAHPRSISRQTRSSPVDPLCNSKEAFPDANETTSSATTLLNRQLSVYQVICNGFGSSSTARPLGDVFCTLLAGAVGASKFKDYQLFAEGACSVKAVVSHDDSTAILCGEVISLIGQVANLDKQLKAYALAAGLACDVGHSLGSWIESESEKQAAKGVWKGKCLKFVTHHFPLTDEWSATPCKHRDKGFTTLPKASKGNTATWTTSGMGFSIPSSYTNTQPSGVSCASATECVAVGSDFESADNQFTAVAELWRGQSWNEMTLPETSGIDLVSVSCPASGFCLAVGRTAFHGNQSSPVADVWENGAWTAEQPLSSPNGGYANLFGVSCSSAADCIAVGAQQAGSSTIPFAEHWSSGTWTVTAMPDGGIELLGVSCASNNSCVAVGGAQQGVYQRPFAEHWDGSQWTVENVPGPPVVKDNQNTWAVGLKAVSCASTRSCVTVGNAGTVLQWDGRRWTLDSAQGGNRVSFAGVSCANPSDCIAVGSGTHGPVIESRSGSRWHQERHTLGPKATLTDVAIQPGGGAIAVGYRTTASAISPVGERRQVR